MSENKSTNTSSATTLSVTPTIVSGLAMLVCFWLALKDFQHWQESSFDWTNVIAACVFGTLFLVIFLLTFRLFRNIEKPDNRLK